MKKLYSLFIVAVFTIVMMVAVNANSPPIGGTSGTLNKHFSVKPPTATSFDVIATFAVRAPNEATYKVVERRSYLDTKLITENKLAFATVAYPIRS